MDREGCFGGFGLGGGGDAVNGHGDGGVVVFHSYELVAPEFPGSHHPAIDLLAEAQVYPLDFFREEERTGAETDGEETGGEFAGALGEGGHDWELL